MARRVCQVESIGLQVNWVVGRVRSGWVYPYFSNKFFILFYFIFIFNYKNKSMTICLKRMNKIN